MRIPGNRAVALRLLVIATVVGSCASGSTPVRSLPPGARVAAGAERPIPLILAVDEGERRLRRTPGFLRGRHDNHPFTMPMNPGRVSHKKFTPQVPLYLCCLVILTGRAVISVQLGHSGVRVDQSV